MTTGRVVNVPCPISAAGDTMVMVPSGAIVSQTFGDTAPRIGASAKASSTNESASGAIVSANAEPGRG